MSARNNRKQSISQIVILSAILIVLNIIGAFIFTRLDMTQDKRYTLSEASKEMASKLDDIVYFKVYLEGDLPPGFRRLKTSAKEMLDEFRIYAGENIQYDFIDPSEHVSGKEQMDLYQQLAKKGLYPTNLEQKGKSEQSQKIIFPGAIVTYKNMEIPLQLLKSRLGSSPEQMLNHSIENLEYEFSSILRKIVNQKNIRVGILRGHGELAMDRLGDAFRALAEFYKVDTVLIDGQLKSLENFQTLIIAGPDQAFNEKDKFILDQFIMRGGKVLWLLDHMQINMDSLSATSTNIALAKDINLDDILFNYGVRINSDLLLDMQSAPIPVVTGYVGNQPNQQLFPWYYFPLLSTESNHPIVHNLNNVKAEFASSVDLIENENIQKTILLTTGKFSRIQMAPARVSLNILRDEPDPKLFAKSNIPAAVLLEGIFKSNYKNRIPEQLANSSEINYKSESDSTSMIIVGDADVISNYVSKKGASYPLGYDRFNGQTYGNRNFILNCVDYLCGNKQILTLRGKDFKLRLIDPAKSEKRTTFQLLNMIGPAMLIIVLGLVFNFFRRKKYMS